jgi:tungstate transport system ATP-binding protein
VVTSTAGALEIIDLSLFKGDTRILLDIKMRIEEGETYALIGPTGGGKTSLLRTVDLLEDNWIGEIRLWGEDVLNLKESMKIDIRRRMAMVFQRPSMLKGDVFRNVALGLQIRGMGGGDIRQRVESVLLSVGLSGYERRAASTLSGGEQQGVAIARALAIDPQILILDEPTA